MRGRAEGHSSRRNAVAFRKRDGGVREEEEETFQTMEATDGEQGDDEGDDKICSCGASSEMDY